MTEQFNPDDLPGNEPALYRALQWARKGFSNELSKWQERAAHARRMLRELREGM